MFFVRKRRKGSSVFLETKGTVPIRVLLCWVAAKTKVKIFTQVAIHPLANNDPLAMIAGVLHAHHLMVVLMAFRLHSTYVRRRNASKINKVIGKKSVVILTLEWSYKFQIPCFRSRLPFLGAINTRSIGMWWIKGERHNAYQLTIMLPPTEQTCLLHWKDSADFSAYRVIIGTSKE